MGTNVKPGTLAGECLEDLGNVSITIQCFLLGIIFQTEHICNLFPYFNHVLLLINNIT